MLHTLYVLLASISSQYKTANCPSKNHTWTNPMRPNACQLRVTRKHAGFSTAWFNIHTVIFNDTWKQPNITAGLLQLATEQLYFRSWRLSVPLKGISGVTGEPGERVTYSLFKIRFSELIEDSKHDHLRTPLCQLIQQTQSHLNGCLTKIYSCWVLKGCSYD